MRRPLQSAGILAATSALVLTGLAAGTVPATAAPTSPEAFARSVHVEDVMAHLEALDAIAEANGGNRAAETEGYEASAEYVESVLEDAGYEPARQEFTAPVQTIESASVVVPGVSPQPDAVPMEFTPGTDADGVTGELVEPADVEGCTPAAWQGVDATGRIALVSRGSCSFVDKSVAAGTAGALGIIVYNNAADTAEPVYGTFFEPIPGSVPSFGVTGAEGAALRLALADDPVAATLTIDETTRTISSFNVVAETPGGRADNVVMLGAHLDGVPEGPGINDNGTGSAAILQTAVELAKAGPTANKVRFAWWGAEELGLHGSTAYVASLDEAQAGAIATYLNFDMIGSPNHMIGVYDADQSTFEAPVAIPPGSEATEDVFTDYFDSVGEPWIDSEYDGRSDYQGFIDAGIPAGGLFTGAEATKTAEEASVFGGTAGAPYDANYHQSGDGIENVSTEALAITVPAVAYATASLAADTSAVNGVQQPTTTTVQLSTARTVYRGAHATAVATVAGATTGTVRFLDGGRVLGTAELRDGRATLPLSGVWSVGRHVITAQFVGSRALTGSQGSASLQVAKASLRSLQVTGRRFRPGTRPLVTVRVGALEGGGRPTGTVRVSVHGKVVAKVTVKASTRTVRVRLPRQDKAVTVRASFRTTSSIRGTSDRTVVRTRRR